MTSVKRLPWIIAATKPSAEFVAKMHLERQGYDVYLPLTCRGLYKGERTGIAPLFPGYVFVDTEPCEGLWRPVVSTRGVTRVLKTGETPCHVPEAIIHQIIRREEGGLIPIRKKDAPSGYAKGDLVRIHEGALTGFEAVFEMDRPADRIRVLVTLFGRVSSVELGRDDVSKVA